jgi:group I intron endonuclease
MVSPSEDILERHGITYWIHLPEHTDICCEGYVGVTVKSADKRFKEHKYCSKRGSNLPIHRAIRKYGDDLVIDTVFEGTFSECLEKEKCLRPLANIGYNVCVGGEVTRLGIQHTEETKSEMSATRRGRKSSPETVKKIRKALTGKIRSDEARANISSAAKTRRVTEGVLNTREKGVKAMREACLALKPWEHSRAVIGNWMIADDIHTFISNHSDCSYADVARHFNVVKHQIIAIVKKIKTGWNPTTDDDWLNFRNKLTPDILEIS